MGWLVRVFASAIARRIAYLLVALIAAYFGIARADAQSCSSATEKCTEGQAYAVCRSELASYIAGRAPVQFRNDRCEKTFPTSTGSVTSKFEYLDGTTWIGGVHRDYYYTRGCSTEPNYTGTGPWSSGGAAKNGSLGCRNGCDGVWSRNGDNSMTWAGTGGNCPENEKSNCDNMPDGYYWNAILNVCEPPKGKCPGGREPNSLGQCAPEPCPEGKVQQPDGTCKNSDNECPAGQIKSPDGKCLPGEGQCAAGEVRGKDGTCKRDSNNDGEPDEGEEEGEGPDGEKVKESFGGGDDCNAPPSCSGSPIMCGQARIQWRIDCNTRKNRNIAGGACNSPPICTGEKCDAMEYTGMLMQWRSACALEKLASVSGDGSNSDLTAIRDALTGTNGNPNYGSESPGSSAWQNGGNTPPGKPNTAGYGWSGSCPQPPSFDVMGQSFQFNVTPLCNWLSLGSYFVLGLAALFSLKIVASKDA